MSLEEQLCQLIENRDYPSVLRFIEANPKLDINALDSDGNSFLSLAGLCGSKSLEFYQFIEGLLANPDFKHANRIDPATQKIPFFDAVSLNDAEFVKIFLKHRYEKNINVISDGAQLWFEKIVTSLKRMQLALQADPSDSNMKALLKKKEVVLSIMRDVTIRHALLTDDLQMIEKLSSLGANLHLPLEDGTLPFQLVEEQPNLKVFTWLKANISGSTKPTTFAQLKPVEQGLREVTSTHEKAVAQVLQQQREAQSKLISQFFGLPTANPAPKSNNSSNSSGLN